MIREIAELLIVVFNALRLMMLVTLASGFWDHDWIEIASSVSALLFLSLFIWSRDPNQEQQEAYPPTAHDTTAVFVDCRWQIDEKS